MASEDNADTEASKSDELKKNEEQKPRHPIFDAITSTDADDVDAVRRIVDTAGNLSVDDLSDETGMTPLMHAAWKGKRAVAEFLLSSAGAAPDAGDHEHGYTALHFAALAGRADLCRVLVEAGARTDAVNSVKRTPAAMAAFVGNHECVRVINNFVPKEAVYYFTRKQPLEDKPKLDPKLARPLHDLVMTMNTNPVRVGLILKGRPELLENVAKAAEILELMADREFKHNRNVNEVLALKFHVIRYIVRDISKQMKKDSESADEKRSPFIERWIKSMLVGREEDGFPAFQEDFLRQAIKEFPYQESQLFKMLVTNFSQNGRRYGEGASAAEYINQAFNGQRGFRDVPDCDSCGDENAAGVKKCSSCKSVAYCSQECQKLHWFAHKKQCKRLKEKREDFERRQEGNPEKPTSKEP